VGSLASRTWVGIALLVAAAIWLVAIGERFAVL
jgi:hypothetical protein